MIFGDIFGVDTHIVRHNDSGAVPICGHPQTIVSRIAQSPGENSSVSSVFPFEGFFKACDPGTLIGWAFQFGNQYPVNGYLEFADTSTVLKLHLSNFSAIYTFSATWQSEIARAHARGKLVMIEGMLLIAGITISYWINYGRLTLKSVYTEPTFVNSNAQEWLGLEPAKWHGASTCVANYVRPDHLRQHFQPS